MKKIGRKMAWAVLILVLISTLTVPQYLYFSGLRDVPDDRAPVSGPVIPHTVASSFWHYLGGKDEPAISPKNPYGFVASFLIESFNVGSGPLSSAEYMLLSQAARALMFREELSGDWHLSNASALIWISRNWTVDEAI